MLEDKFQLQDGLKYMYTVIYFGSFVLPIVLLLVLPAAMYFMLRSWRQVILWQAGLILASAVAFLGYFRLEVILAPPLPVPAAVIWVLKTLSILSPAMIAIAWSRRIGVKWRQSLLILIFVPVGAFTLWLIASIPLG